MKLLSVEIKRIFVTEHMWLACTSYIVISIILSLFYFPSKLEIENYPEFFACGSAVFIRKSGIDWLLVFLIMLLSSVIFLKRHSDGIDALVKICPLNDQLALIDIMIILIIIPVLSLSSSFIKLVIYNIKFSSVPVLITSIGEDMSSYSTPLLSSSCSIYICLISALGSVCFTVYNIFFSSLIKKAVPYYTVVLGTLIIPAYIFIKSYQRARIFLPISLLDAKLLFYGTQIISEDDISGKEYAFLEVTKQELVVNILVQTLICFFGVFFTIRLLSGKHLFYFRKKACILMSLIVFTLTACNDTIPNANIDKFIVVDENLGLVYNKQTKQLININFTPFENKIANCVNGKYVIALSFANEEKTAYIIEAVSPETCESKILLTVGRNINNDGFIGLDNIISFPASLIIDFNTYGLPINFQISNNKIYFELEDRLVCFDLVENGKRTDLLTDRIFHNAKCAGDRIYYLNENDMLCFDKNGEEAVVSEEPVSEYEISERSVYYITASNSLLSKNNKVISNEKAQYILYTDDDSAVFIADEGTVTIKSDIKYKADIYADMSDGEYLYTYDGQSFEIFDLSGNSVDKQSLI